MATTADFVLASGAGRTPRARTSAQTFFARYLLGLAIFILVAFAQFDLRMTAPPVALPWVVHAHAASMLAWLAVIVAQPRIAGAGAQAWHRRLGWASMALLASIVTFASMTCVAALRLGLIPPFFTPAYFLALVHVGVLAFAATVLWAVAERKRTDWHRRLIAGSTLVILEPALGRLLPMPLLGVWGEWLALACQLGALGFLVAHDRRTLARVHPATLACGAILIATHVAIEALAVSTPVRELAASIAAG